SFHYVFPIREISGDSRVLIIDEASMISNKESKHELYSFGTDKLLDDILTYSGIPYSGNKIIFVGDPAQLPPVVDNQSLALVPEYFEKLGITTQFTTLKEVVRQQGNIILQNANKIRALIGAEVRSELTLDYDETCFIKTQSDDLASVYAEHNPLPEIGQSVIIAFSNTQCLKYNKAIRKIIFPGNDIVTAGDLLIINHNNYHTYGVELMNGEMAKVMEVDPNVITRQNIPVYEKIEGKRVKKNITLNFRTIKIRVEHHPNEINCLIIDSLLNSPNPDLTISEMKALYVDFVMRFKEEQERRKKEGLPYHKVGSEVFKEKLKKDAYFNALRVKYGYAITCHKAQGGEWQTAYIDYFGRTSLKDNPLRWCYTATTRAVQRCYAANAPNVTQFSKFSIAEIQPLTNVPENALALDHVPLSPYHSENQHKAKSLKYWEITEKLENTPFQIISVQSLGGYQERYTISYQDEQDIFDIYHNKAGIFDEFKAVAANRYNWHKDILPILNQPYQIRYNVNYSPSLKVLEKLYGLMQSACDEADVIITNIVEFTKNYYVLYFLKTDAKCALIQFYYDGKQQLTRALPKSTDSDKDKKLKRLIIRLSEYNTV
ncbi:MAG: ATP-binding domain-containing protein, partial [Chitinophagales bacterium]|nr:ATP-binding domain-containing protein [Chitinophagales bacterium]